MISQLRGQLIDKTPPQIVIDVNGVGYEVDVSMTTFYQLPSLGETVKLYTQLIVREDAHLLFGFADTHERTTFRQLLKVSGIGAKTALGVLSTLTPDELALAVALENVKKLSSAPGVGKKTAERMILELRGKLISASLHDELDLPIAAPTNFLDDIFKTLIALGYNEKQASPAVKNVPHHVDFSEGVRIALKYITR